MHAIQDATTTEVISWLCVCVCVYVFSGWCWMDNCQNFNTHTHIDTLAYSCALKAHFRFHFNGSKMEWIRFETLCACVYECVSSGHTNFQKKKMPSEIGDTSIHTSTPIDVSKRRSYFSISFCYSTGFRFCSHSSFTFCIEHICLDAHHAYRPTATYRTLSEHVNMSGLAVHCLYNAQKRIAKNKSDEIDRTFYMIYEPTVLRTEHRNLQQIKRQIAIENEVMLAPSIILVCSFNFTIPLSQSCHWWNR